MMVTMAANTPLNIARLPLVMIFVLAVILKKLGPVTLPNCSHPV